MLQNVTWESWTEVIAGKKNIAHNQRPEHRPRLRVVPVPKIHISAGIFRGAGREVDDVLRTHVAIPTDVRRTGGWRSRVLRAEGINGKDWDQRKNSFHKRERDPVGSFSHCNLLLTVFSLPSAHRCAEIPGRSRYS